MITFDADGQHRIEDINSIIKPIKDKEADIVIGSRFLDKKSKEMPNYRKVGIKIITKITNLSIKEKLTDSQSGFRAYNKKTLEEITPSDKGMGVSTEILIKASNLELKVAEVPIKVHYDVDTSTQNPVSHGTSVILSTIKFTSIHNPLKFLWYPRYNLLNHWFELYCMDTPDLCGKWADSYKCFTNWNWLYSTWSDSSYDCCDSIFDCYCSKRKK